MSLFVSQEEDTSFTASTNQISHLADVLSSITTINNHALMIITSKGITFFAEYNHILNVQLMIDPSLFTSYSLSGPSKYQDSLSEDDELRLGVDISMIAESFASAIASAKPDDNILCYINYRGEGSPFVIEFEDSLISEKIEFLTFYVDITYPYDQIDDDSDQYNLVINHNEIECELILKSDVFANLLQDLLQINTIDLYIFVSNKWRNLGESSRSAHRREKQVSGQAFVDNQLNFISKGIIGHLKLFYPNNKAILEKLNIYGKTPGQAGLDRLQEMEPMNASLISCYNFTNFIKIFKAVKLSTKCKMMKDLSGVLSLQLLCKNPKLANYSGTLITFNMLEVSNISENTDGNILSLNNIFEDDFYEYIREINPAKPAPEYEDLAEAPLYDKFRSDEIETVGGAVEVPLFF